MKSTTLKPLVREFEVERNRRGDKPIEDRGGELSPTHWIDKAVGFRYQDCTVDGFDVGNDDFTPERIKAVEAARDYVLNFPKYFADGRGMVWIGPKGTGKDHLMVAVIRAIATASGCQSIRFRSGEQFFDEFKALIGTGGSYAEQAEKSSWQPILALSDPLPVKGELSDHDQGCLFRVLLRRYREMRPTLATINVANRDELEQRMGPQSADRLLENAFIVKCNWPSYRQGVKS